MDFYFGLVALITLSPFYALATDPFPPKRFVEQEAHAISESLNTPSSGAVGPAVSPKKVRTKLGPDLTDVVTGQQECSISFSGFSPDGKEFLVVYQTGHLAKFDPRTGSLVEFIASGYKPEQPRWKGDEFNLEHLKSPFSTLSASARLFAVGGREFTWKKDGEMLVAPSEITADPIKVFDLSKSSKSPALELDVVGLGPVRGVHFSPDEKMVVTSHGRVQPAFIVWDISNGKVKRRFSLNNIENRSSVAPSIRSFSPDSNRLSIWGLPTNAEDANDTRLGMLTSYDLKTGKVLSEKQDPNVKMTEKDGIAVLLNGGSEFVGRRIEYGDKGLVKLFAGGSESPFLSFRPAKEEAVGIDFTKDRRLAVVDTFGGSSLWDMTSGQKIAALSSRANFASHSSLSVDGSIVAVPSSNCDFDFHQTSDLINLPKTEKAESLQRASQILKSKTDPIQALSLLKYMDENPDYAGRVLESYQSNLPSTEPGSIRRLIRGLEAETRRERDESMKELTRLGHTSARNEILSQLRNVAKSKAEIEEVKIRAQKVLSSVENAEWSDSELRRLISVAEKLNTDAAKTFLKKWKISETTMK